MNNTVIHGSVLAKRILQAREHNGYCGATIEGKRAIGKSAYCLKVSMQVYKSLYNCSDMEAYDHVLKTCLFTIRDVIDILKATVDRDEILPVCVWDDAMVHASSMMYFIDLRETNELKSIVETIRTATTSLLLNCTDRGGLLSFLRKSDDLLVEIVMSQNGGHDRVARGYNVFKLPSGKRLIYKQFEDDFSCFIPNAVYEIYYERRKKYLKEALKRMAEMTANTDRTNKYSKIKKSLEEISLDSRVEKLRKKGIELEV